MVFAETGIGERHRWMYDVYGLKLLFEENGFCDCTAFSYNESGIPNFQEDFLDCNTDSSSYKNNSIYIEGKKPAERDAALDGDSAALHPRQRACPLGVP